MSSHDRLPASSAMLYVGTHRRAHRSDADDTAFGIYAFAAAPSPGLVPIGLTETLQPGWLAFHPTRPFLYAVNEVRSIDGRNGGAVSAFERDTTTGALRALNRRPLPPMPCHCTVDATGRYLFVATFGGGSVHVFPLEADGPIGVEHQREDHVGSSLHTVRQTAPHAHAVVPSPDNRFLLAPDLGADRLFVYVFDQDVGRLVPRPDNAVCLPPLSGPRHVVFSPDARHCYLINEMSATVCLFGWHAESGTLDLRQTVDLLPPGFDGLKSGAALLLHPSGGHLYATTRSHGSSGLPAKPGLDLLVWFAVDPDSGRLTLGERLPTGGSIARSMALSPDARRLLVGHQCSGDIVTFALDQGVPKPSGDRIPTPVPVCLAFAP